jgi:hypothetical protein
MRELACQPWSHLMVLSRIQVLSARLSRAAGQPALHRGRSAGCVRAPDGSDYFLCGRVRGRYGIAPPMPTPLGQETVGVVDALSGLQLSTGQPRLV